MLALLCMAAFLAACGLGGSLEIDREATVAALGQLIVQTATAAVGEQVSPQDLLATAEAAATEAVATIAAVSTEAAAAAVTATAIAGQPSAEGTPPPPGAEALSPEAIQAELMLYSLDPSQGVVAWVEDSVVLEGPPGLQQASPDDSMAALQDFVLVADVTGDAAGESACGFALRAGTVDPVSSQYLALIAAGREGVIFQTWQGGSLLADQTLELPAVGLDPNYNLQSGATNRLAVVARGDTFAVYTNGVRLDEFTPVTRLAQGTVAIAGASDASPIACRFDNAWLWVISRR